MNFKVVGGLIAVAFTASVLLSVIPNGLAQDFSFSYKLVTYSDGTFSYSLNIGMSQKLIEYYKEQNHRAGFDSDFEKFVTPYAVKPIADALREIYPADEDFANGVLTIVHQIPYEETVAEFYPVESLARNKGDCDMFSLLASSIMKAGGLDVVLLHYVNQEHMNIGVHLDQEPQHARQGFYSVKAGNITYYIAECTSTNWKDGWRIGECPSDLQTASPKVLTLENSELNSPEQVYAKIQKLDEATLQLSVSPILSLEAGSVTIQGQLFPPAPNENVTIYSSTDGSAWNEIDTTKTQLDGQFSYIWKSTGIGQVNLRAIWIGNDKFAGAASGNQFTIILPFYLAFSLSAAIAAVVICSVAFIVKRKNRRKVTSRNNL